LNRRKPCTLTKGREPENLAHLQWGDNQKISHTYKGETTRKSRKLTKGRQPENLAHLQWGDNRKATLIEQ